MIVCNGYKCTLLENPFVFQIQFCPPEEHTQVGYLLLDRYHFLQTTGNHDPVFQGEVEIVLHNGNRIEVIKNTLSVIHEDEIIFNFDNRKTPYVMVTNFLTEATENKFFPLPVPDSNSLTQTWSLPNPKSSQVLNRTEFSNSCRKLAENYRHS